jgi:DNA-binding GntR family transcriptional regulator
MTKRDGGSQREQRGGRMGRRDRNLLSHQVFIDLESAIITRVYPPGTHLVEEDIAAEMGVSRMPVREAFRMLQRAGWIEVTPYAGARVRFPQLQELHAVFELRHRLGQFAAELAALRATPDEHGALRRLVEDGTAALDRGDTYVLAELNWDFHRVLASCAHNEALRRTLEDLDKQLRWHFAATTSARGRDSWTEHAQIVDAVLARDAPLAARLTFEHSRRSEAAYMRELMPYSPGAGAAAAEAPAPTEAAPAAVEAPTPGAAAEPSA